jgi:hypothetical protein
VSSSVLNDYWLEVAASEPALDLQSVSDQADLTDKLPDRTEKEKPIEPRCTSSDLEVAYLRGAAIARRSLLKTWCACVVGTALSFSLVSGLKDVRSLVTTSLSAGSVAFIVSAIGKKE